MECESIKINIPLFLGERLSSDERREIAHHIEACARCRQEMMELERTWNLMDRWEIEEPSAMIKSGLMTAVRKELQEVQIPWWVSFKRSSIFQTVLGALGFSLITFLIIPYDQAIELCETNISNAGLLAFFPKGLIYFVLGLLYGLIPVSISGICFLKSAEENPLIKGLGIGSIFAAFLVPFFIMQCPEFASGLIFIMALGIIVGSLSGGMGTLWVFSSVSMRISP
jgi:hypothetical protein